jgi:hypothetical protein
MGAPGRGSSGHPSPEKGCRLWLSYPSARTQPSKEVQARQKPFTSLPVWCRVGFVLWLMKEPPPLFVLGMLSRGPPSIRSMHEATRRFAEFPKGSACNLGPAGHLGQLLMWLHLLPEMAGAPAISAGLQLLIPFPSWTQRTVCPRHAY